MGYVLVVFVVCMILKDVTLAPFPYVLRGAAQTLCLATGLITLLATLPTSLFARYWPVLGYLLVLLLTSPFTLFPGFVLLEILSLSSAVVFAVALFEAPQLTRQKRLSQFVLCIVLVYGVIILASLILARLQPGLTFEALFAGNETGVELRFRGLFSKSGVMGAASGILVGLSAIRIKRLPLKLMFMLPGLACLALTQSRSFWLAAFVAGGITAWRYYPHLRKWILASVGVVTLAGAVFVAFKISVDTAAVRNFVRLESVSNFTGRTEIWQTAFEGWSKRPWFGYGYTMGGLGLVDNQEAYSASDPTQFSRMTLHNGYFQSVLDAGIVGFVFYAMIFLISTSRVIRFDSERRFPEVMYVLAFLAIANVGESVVYSGAIFQSLCFWVFAVFAMGLKVSGEAAKKTASPDASQGSSLGMVRPRNLLQ
jgi:O-antigen ligase